ncbi:hypothetical protein RclHR1_30040004 [Rhizophagus clarus]|uniref:Uncharacterized protein n=1 Tax=Rhizophagus clarus TaxID=94130 RepID=A0A2Z6R656_9GLOM|nr:hypothetical protein RclHR1_30040004 [Rhizophagus clarus]
MVCPDAAKLANLLVGIINRVDILILEAGDVSYRIFAEYGLQLTWSLDWCKRDTATNNALQADLAADKKRIKQSNLQSEKDVASDLFADTPNHPPKTFSSKGKTKSKNSRSHLSRAQALSQNIVNNLNGTNCIPAPAAPAVTPKVTDQNDQ